MSSLSPEAQNLLKVVKELRTLDDVSLKVLEQLLAFRVNSDVVTTLVAGKEEQIAAAVLKAAAGTHAVPVLGYLLRFFADLVAHAKTVAMQLGREDSQGVFGVDPAVLFLNLSDEHTDCGVTNPAVFLAAQALRFSPVNSRNDAVRRFLSKAVRTFSATPLNLNEMEFVVNACVVLAKRKELRGMICDSGLVELIPRILTETCTNDLAGMVQVLYEGLLLTWLLSFEYPCLVVMNRVKMIPTIHRVIQRVSKEKCIRVAIMTLRNFVAAQNKYFNVTHQSVEWVDPSVYRLGEINGNKGPNFFHEMVGIGLMKSLWQLSRRKFGDEDIAKDVEDLSVSLEASLEVLTSFSEYRGEVHSGILEWSPVHSSAKFWKENYTKFEDGNYEVLRDLCRIVMNAKSDVTLAVACHDVGELVRYHPTGRMLLQLPQVQGLKERIMTLMSDPNPEVAKHALLAVQKIMVQRWEFIK
jgi:V-type H+-transporting ATPase subunit H